MVTQKHLFKGAWHVVSLEYRIAGEWHLIFKPAHDEWSIDFLPGGVFVDLYHPEGDSDSGRWTYDAAGEVISVHPNSGPEGFVKKYVFCEAPGIEVSEGGDGSRESVGDGGTDWAAEAHLYLFDDLPHGRHEACDIMDHHAHTRLGLVRVFR
jgi:hypothetical protein